MTTLTLNPQDKQLVARVANWDAFGTTNYTAQDIEAVTVHDGMVDIYFVEGGKEIIPVGDFKEWIEMFKAELNEEQVEITTAAIDSPFQSEINFTDAVASFYTENNRFMGTVRKLQYNWQATTETTFTAFTSAESAVQSLTTCSYQEWEEAVEGVQGIRYVGKGWWRYGNGRVNTCNLLDILHLEKTDRQIAILEKQILIAD